MNGNSYYLSIVKDGAGWDEGTPNPRPIPLSEVPDPLILMPDNPESYNAILKICDEATGDFHNVQVSTGNTHGVDVDNGAHDLTLQGKVGLTSNPCNEVLMVKGGVGPGIFSLDFYGRGKFWDICIDQWGKNVPPRTPDHWKEYSHDLDFSFCKHVDGKPLRVCVVHQPLAALWGNFSKTRIQLGDNCKVVLFWSLVNRIAWYLKSWGLMK